MQAYYEAWAPECDSWYLGTGRYAGLERPGFAEELRAVERTLASLPPVRVLDVACGTGFFTRHLRGDVVGLDQSDAMLALARGQARAATFVRGDALALPFPDGSFDRVFAGHFYGHLEESERARFLAEARRVASELVVLDSSLREGVEPEERQERLVADGRRFLVYKRYFTAEGLAAELGGTIVFAGEWFVGARTENGKLLTVNCCPLSPAVSRPAYRSLAALQRDNRRCRACAEAGYPLESLPVLEGRAGQRAYLFGQAPGAVEGAERRPWRGRAGRALRAWLGLDEEAFYATFYCASVTRCYPGKSPSGRGDRAPAPRERELCAFWRDEEIRLLRPELVVTVGGLAARALLGLPSLTGAVGERFSLGGACAVPLPHPSGASGWLNDAANRRRLDRALALLRAELLGRPA